MNDAIRDGGLTTIASKADRRMDICYTQEPANYTEATSTYTCGNKTSLSTGAIADGTTNGRSVSTAAITDGSVTDTQTAGWWGLSDGSANLHAAYSLSASQAVTSGNTFTLDAVEINIADAA